ncbi:hypothetical protein NMG60_11033881 [Bertholletia excelsa]
MKKPETQVKLLPSVLGIQGLIYCKSGSKLIPLQGAVAPVTCLATAPNGYESAPFSFLSSPTDSKGYFFSTVSRHEVEDGRNLTGYKACLGKSPLEACKIPTDVNKGITGGLLSSYRILKDKNVKFYSAGPFLCTTETKPVSNGY